MMFTSAAHCEAYKAAVRPKMMEKMKGIMGGQNYNVEGEAVSHYTAPGKKAAPGMILRMGSYKCKAGSEESFKRVMSEVCGGSGSVPGLIWYAYIFSDSRTVNTSMVFESQAALDAYKTSMRSKYASQT